MDGTLLVAIALGALALGLLLLMYLRSRDRTPDPPSRTWEGETGVTPKLAKRNKPVDRAARRSTLVQGVRLARAMGKQLGDDEDVVQGRCWDFVNKFVIEADADFADVVLEEGREASLGEGGVDEAIEVIKALASRGQARLVVHLLLYASGETVDDAHLTYAQQVGEALGLPPNLVKAMSSADEPSYVEDIDAWRAQKRAEPPS